MRETTVLFICSRRVWLLLLRHQSGTKREESTSSRLNDGVSLYLFGIHAWLSWGTLTAVKTTRNPVQIDIGSIFLGQNVDERMSPQILVLFLYSANQLSFRENDNKMQFL